MLPYRDSRLTHFAILIFFVAVAAYAYFEARGVLFGPTISVPSAVQQVHDRFVHIKGRAEHIASLTMNGSPITVTERGEFDQPYLLSPGLNRIVLDAKDKYGRTRQKIIQIVYTPDGSQNTEQVSTTTAVTTSATSTQ